MALPLNCLKGLHLEVPHPCPSVPSGVPVSRNPLGTMGSTRVAAMALVRGTWRVVHDFRQAACPRVRGEMPGCCRLEW